MSRHRVPKGSKYIVTLDIDELRVGTLLDVMVRYEQLNGKDKGIANAQYFTIEVVKNITKKPLSGG